MEWKEVITIIGTLSAIMSTLILLTTKDTHRRIENINKRIDDAKDSINKRVDDTNSLLNTIMGKLFTRSKK